MYYYIMYILFNVGCLNITVTEIKATATCISICLCIICMDDKLLLTWPTFFFHLIMLLGRSVILPSGYNKVHVNNFSCTVCGDQPTLLVKKDPLNHLSHRKFGCPAPPLDGRNTVSYLKHSVIGQEVFGACRHHT